MKNIKRIYFIAILVIGAGNTYAQTEATWYTSMGTFKTELTDTLTPIAVDSFIARVSEKL